ncbi:putative Anaphase-promoting complex subunit 5 domain-containing protein [Frankia sp. AiPs1]|uniref:tetratricopeptide repeat protein n=1 Tax=Frankia sp. AiPa1 TaxID=573492 RepID=UPI00202AF8AA|nr:tetratricopeptide repeat protein [Frankia sp. AiPa1]MCL9760983.1 tetratricopeptide repeat-containing serine protease family protein [Frankia sp. AiPa1]
MAGPASAASVPARQVVEVRSTRADGRTRVGSGLLVTGRLVLTAAHVVFPDGPAPARRIRLLVGVGLTKRARVWGRVAWSGSWPSPGRPLDAALVRIDDPDWVPPAMDRLRWGVPTGRAGGLRAEAVGFPRVLRGADGVRETNHLLGHVNPLGGMLTGRYDLHVDDPPPLAPMGDDEPLPWSGMSGAVMFTCADPAATAPVWLATGVIVVDTPGFGEARLSVLPIRRVLEDPDAVGLLRNESGPTDWESVELAGLLTPPAVTVAQTPAQLLRADAEIVTMHGREPLLADFTAWCGDEQDSAVRLLAGPGGQGKTRFARALTTRMRQAGWLAGMARPGAASLAGRLVDSELPVLLVVDYAETQTALVDVLIGALAQRGTPTPLRLLLIARGAEDWWDELTFRHDLADTAQIIYLPSVESAGVDRAELFTDAVRVFTDELARLDPAVDWPGRAARVAVGRPELSDLGFEVVLAVHMAALAALLEQPDPPEPDPSKPDLPEPGTSEPGRWLIPAAPPTPPTPPVAESGQGGPATASPAQVADLLLRHETRYWRQSARLRGIERSSDILDQAVATSTLCGASDRDEAAATLARLPGFTGTDGAAHDLRGRVARWLAGLYPPPPDRPGQFWGGMSPDRLAEHFLARALSGPSGMPELARQTLAGSSDAQLHQALTVLTRAAPAHSNLAPLIRALLAEDPARRAPVALQVAVEVLDPEAVIVAIYSVLSDLDRDVLTRMVDALPGYSVRLLGLAARLQYAHTTRIRELAPAPPRPGWWRRWRDLIPRPRRPSDEDLAAHLPQLASSLNNLGRRLADLDRREDALAAVDEATGIYRRLAAAQPDRHLAGLAASLNNLARRLGDQGRYEQALATVEEATALYRRLAADGSDAHLAQLAASLDNLARRLADLRRPDEALTVMREATDAYQRLADAQPERYLAELATSLNNLSNRLADLGRIEEAMAVIGHAVRLREQLAQADPDAHLPGLAASLNNLALRLGTLGRPAGALAPIGQAVAIFTMLDQAEPGAFGVHLATARSNQAAFALQNGTAPATDIERDTTGRQAAGRAATGPMVIAPDTGGRAGADRAQAPLEELW